MGLRGCTPLPGLPSPAPGTRTGIERSGLIQTGHVCWSPCPTAQPSWSELQEVHREQKAEVPRARAAPVATGWEGQQFLMGSIDFCSPRPATGPVEFKRPLPYMLHLLTPFKPNLLARFAFHPTLSQGLAQHSRMGGEQMACSNPSHLFSLKTLSKENP